MNFSYSVIRFVPDVAQGEFVNVGVVVVGGEPCKAIVRLAPSPARARHLAPAKIVKNFWDYIQDLRHDIERDSKGMDQPKIAKWVNDIGSSDLSMVQFSSPAPIVCDEIESAADMMAEQFLSSYLRPKRQKRHTKQATARKVRQTYKNIGLVTGRHLIEHLEVSGQAHTEPFDFAVKNGEIVQLTQAWNFGVVDQRTVMENVKAWAFTVADIKESGGVGRSGKKSIKVPKTVEVRAVYDEPTNARSRETLEEAIHAFDKVEAIPTSVQDLGELGEIASALIES